MSRRLLLPLLALALSGVAQAQPTYPPITFEHRTLDAVGITLPSLVYVRSPRTLTPCTAPSGICPARWAEFGHPYAVNPGTDLMLWHPDGTEEVLVTGGPGAVQDPAVDPTGTKVAYTLFHKAEGAANAQGADIYVIDVPTRQITRVTQQGFVHPRGLIPNYGTYNIHPVWLSDNKLAYVSNRSGSLPPPKSFPPHALQLHTVDVSGDNIELLAPMNLGSALHPFVMKDGRIVFSSLENMGRRRGILWGLWSIWQDGTVWNPVVSAFFQASGAHFETQLSSGEMCWILYYNQNQKGFGTLFCQAAHGGFGPADLKDARNPKFPYMGGRTIQLPFSPTGLRHLTPWATGDDIPALPSIAGDPASPRIGKVTHPAALPDGHLAVVWSPGPIGGNNASVQQLGPSPIDSGLYLVLNAARTESPDELVLIQNNPNYNEMWPKPLVPYERLYGVPAPAALRQTPDGSQHAALPAGTPFGLIGTSSLYKRESAPLGAVPVDGVTAIRPNWTTGANTASEWDWEHQGSDVGRYANSEIHALRIVTFEPNAWRPLPKFGPDPKTNYYPHYLNHVMERLRILGEIPVRKYHPDGSPVLDPDGNPDTSFLAKIPADVAFTFQTLDKDGLVLNMAQTWHQVRPGEVRNDCGGCHAHSQTPTPFESTAAAQPGYAIADLTAVGLAKTYTREKHLPPGVTLNPDDKAQVTPLQARCSPGYWVLAGTQYDCPGITPLPADTVLSDHQLSSQELGDLARLIDTGACYGPACEGDDTRPTLTVSWPMPGANVGPLTEIRLGMHDYVSNLAMASLSVLLDGVELAPLCQPLPDWRWTCALPAPIASLERGVLDVRIADTSGNVAQITRSFRVQSAPVPQHAEGAWSVDGARLTCQAVGTGTTADAAIVTVGACVQ